MRKRAKKKWPRITAMILVAAVLTGSVALILVEKLAPDQEYIPKQIVELPAKVVAAVVAPMQYAFASLANGISGYLESLKLRKNIEIAYNELKAQNDELVYRALTSEENERRIEELETLMDIYNEKKAENLNPIVATVIDKEIGNWFQMFTINVGEVHGVQKNMAVINTEGLVGYIHKVNVTSSEVVTIVDSRAGIGGRIQSTRDQGIIKGTLGIDDEATCRMYYLPVDTVPRPGDMVVTSGIGSPFPQGLEIGYVRESTRYMDQNKHYVVIEPLVDFSRIETVIVLNYKADGENMPEQANDGQIDYVQQPMDTIRPHPSVGTLMDDPNRGAITPPPRSSRGPTDSDEIAGEAATQDPNFTLEPGATPTPNPELDELLRQELEEMGYEEDEMNFPGTEEDSLEDEGND